MAELRREDPPRVVSVLSSVLRRVMELNDLAIHGRLAAPHPRASAFHVPRVPGISVQSYLERIFRHADCSPTCYVVAYVYLERFAQRHPPVFINSLNVHLLLLTSILTAVKFMERIHYDNAYFARVGGITLMEMNNLEVNFLFGVGFELNVTPTVFYSYCSRLREEMYLLESPPAPPRSPSCLTEEESDSGSWLFERRSSTYIDE
ncbi:cyclin-P4-1 [Elaeis guineensis]|uniref:Cyclin n=1 Tax=Elaeis guineensis var. tenera TaxID=51953 RepID=A0A6I9RY22_ELAGV|nr:cyclin-P4-1 [Elaeis guineensis]